VQNIPEASVTFKNNSDLTDYVTMSIQVNHDWKHGSDIFPHIHWWQAGSVTPNWLIQYRWQAQGTAKTGTWTYQPWTSNAYTWSSGTLNQISAFGTITPPAAASLSDIVQFRILRDVDNDSSQFAGTDPAAAVDVDAVNFDIHIQVDSFGSNQEYVK
jgi:hypothetical protein